MEIFLANVIFFNNELYFYAFLIQALLCDFDAVIRRLDSLGAFMLKIYALDVESFHT